LELLFETVQTIATEAFNPMPHQQGQVLNNRKRTEIEMQTADNSLAKKYLFLTRTKQTLSGTTMQKYQHCTEKFKRHKILQGFKEYPNSQQESLLHIIK
jgi:hypothetical protein